MKKSKIILSKILIMLLLVTGCTNMKKNNSKDIKLDPKNPVIITLVTYYNDRQLNEIKKMISEFNETEGSEKGIIVEVIGSGSINDANKILTDSANNAPGSVDFPNMFITYKGIITDLEDKIQVVDYNDYFTKKELDEILPNLLELGRFENENKLSMLPVGVSTVITFINKTDFDRVSENIDISYNDLETYEGIIKAAEKYYNYTDSLTDTPNDGKAFYGTDSIVEQVFSLYKSMGKEMLVKEKDQVKLNFDKRIARKLWEIFYVPAMKGYFAKYGKFTSEDVKTGKILVATASTTGAGYFPDKIMDQDGIERTIKIQTMSSPYIENQEKLEIQQGGGLFMTKSTPVKEYASSVFIKWFLNKENNTVFALRSSYIPVREDNTDIEYIKDEINKLKLEEKISSPIITSIKQIKNRNLYVSPTVKGYEDTRLVVKSIFDKEIKESRKELLEKVSQGEDYDTLLVEKLSEESFENWYNDSLKRLQQNI